MKTARLYSFEDIRIEEMPVPEPGPGEALLKTMASGICSGDLMAWYIEKKAPLTLGHEPSGVIVKTGAGVAGFRPGDRVAVHHHAPCMDTEGCQFCRRGDFVHCPTWKASSIYPGGISEYILIPRVNLEQDTLILPPGVSFEDGMLVEPLGCVLKAIRRAGLNIGQPQRGQPQRDWSQGNWFRRDWFPETAVVIGLGVMGILHLIVLKALGVKKVIGADRVSFRLRKAMELGADHVIDVSREDFERAVSGLTAGGMAELVIALPNSVQAIMAAIKAAGTGAKIILFTPAKPGEVLPIDPNEIYFREISLIPSYSTGPEETRAALGMIGEGRVSARMVVTHRFPIEETRRAYRLAAEAGDSLKVAITFE
ncbi:MAG: alcohol dehydrogenase catalytic domain-containing protein [Nitrospiraceae bacterium]|nr:alcohol dehydrogenase catalytic domain-containing protein [Nitrospiraceae bacterium]